MNILKTALAAGAIAAAGLTATAADAATKIVVGPHHARVVVTKPGTHHVIYRAPVRVANGWYAEPTIYHPYAYYRGNPRLNACFQVTQRGFSGHRAVTFGATLCYGRNGVQYVVPASRHIVRWL